MAINAVVTAPTNTISGNFNARVALDASVSDFFQTAVTLTSISGNGRTDVEFQILGGGSNYNLDFTLPEGESGSFRISVTGMLTRIGESEAEEVTSSEATVTYDNITSVTAIIQPARYENGEIVIPIIFGEEIFYFSKTDCEVKHISGDPIHDFEYFLNGRGRFYDLVFIPEPNRLGLFSVDIVEHVWKSSGVIRDDVISTPRLVPFNSTEPRLTVYESLGELEPGIWDILLGFDIPVMGMDLNRFTYEGENPSTPKLYCHESLSDKPEPPVHPVDVNDFPDRVQEWFTPTLASMDRGSIEPSRYFLLRFNVPEGRSGAFFVNLIPGFVRAVN